MTPIQDARPPSVADLVCAPADVAYFDGSGPGIPDARLGTAVELLSLGSGPSLLNTERFVVAGAPGLEDDEYEGFVNVKTASLAEGTIAAPHTATQQLTSDDGDGARGYVDTTWSYGRGLLAVDLIACHQVMSGPPPLYEGCGEELLVGAPDTFVAASAGYVDVWQQSSDPNTALEWAGRVVPPLSYGDDARFGYAIAAPPLALPADAPWEAVGDDCPDWVAIGAPGAQVVAVYSDLDCSDPADPFAGATYWDIFAGTALGPSANAAGFGSTIAAGDIDGDGEPDLVIGAPGGDADPCGDVLVVRGNPSLGRPDATFGFKHLFLDYGGGCSLTTPDRFGEALAVGDIDFDDDQARVLVGAPGFEDGYARGLVCQVDIDDIDNSTSATTNCFSAPVDPDETNDYEFGSALAIGNFVAVDERGAVNTPAAALPEVAVGAAGVDVSGANAVGQVWFFLTAEEGMFHTSGSDVVLNDFTSQVVNHDDDADDADDRFGETFAAGYIQARRWEDLVIGVPGDESDEGSLTLTKATGQSACQEILGAWETLDSAGNPRPVRIYVTPLDHNTTLQFPEGFTFEFREALGVGALCTADIDEGGTTTTYDMVVELPPNTEFEMIPAGGPQPWMCGSSSQTWMDVPADTISQEFLDSVGHGDKAVTGQVMDVTITYVGGPTPSGTLLIDAAKIDFEAMSANPECRIAEQPYVLADWDRLCE